MIPLRPPQVCSGQRPAPCLSAWGYQEEFSSVSPHSALLSLLIRPQVHNWCISAGVVAWPCRPEPRAASEFTPSLYARQRCHHPASPCSQVLPAPAAVSLSRSQVFQNSLLRFEVPPSVLAWWGKEGSGWDRHRVVWDGPAPPVSVQGQRDPHLGLGKSLSSHLGTAQQHQPHSWTGAEPSSASPRQAQLCSSDIALQNQ